MNTIPKKAENPNGFHQKYFIAKFIPGIDYSKYELEDCIMPVDEDAEYFVLRLDKNGSDLIYIEACRQAVLTYAAAIKNHLPKLSEDLFKRYGI